MATYRRGVVSGRGRRPGGGQSGLPRRRDHGVGGGRVVRWVGGSERWADGSGGCGGVQGALEEPPPPLRARLFPYTRNRDLAAAAAVARTQQSGSSAFRRCFVGA